MGFKRAREQSDISQHDLWFNHYFIDPLKAVLRDLKQSQKSFASCLESLSTPGLSALTQTQSLPYKHQFFPALLGSSDQGWDSGICHVPPKQLYGV